MMYLATRPRTHRTWAFVTGRTIAAVTSTYRIIGSVLVLLLYGGLPTAAGAQPANVEPDFGVAGELDVEAHDQNDSVLSVVKIRFNGAFKGAHWLITTIPVSFTFSDEARARAWQADNAAGIAKTGFGSVDIWFQAGSDAKDTYSLTVLGEYKASAGATVRPGPVPFNDGISHVVPIWLAYASAAFLNSNTTHRVLPLWPLEERAPIWSQGVSFPYIWRPCPQPPGLPLDLQVLSEGKDYAVPKPNTVGTYKAVSLKPPFSKGFTLCRYVALVETNMAGCVLPLEFRLAVFSPKRGARTTNDIYSRYIYRGKATELRSKSDVTDFRPTIGPIRVVQVLDYRFATQDAPLLVDYIVTNGQWRTRDDGEVLETYKNRERLARQYRSSGIGPLGYVVFGLFLAVPVVVIGYARRRAARANEQQHIRRSHNEKIQ